MKSIIKLIGILLCALLTFTAILYIYLVARPDIPPFDESALALDRRSIPDNQNGFIVIEKAVAAAPYFSNKRHIYEQTKDRRMPTSAEAELAIQTYGTAISLVEKAVKYKQFQSPELNNPKHKLPIILTLRTIAQVMMTLAWNDLRNGRAEPALQKITSSFKLARALQNSRCGIICQLIGDTIQQTTLQEVNAMIDEKILPRDTFPALLATLSEQQDSLITGLKDAWKSEYWIGKNRWLEMMKDEKFAKDVGFTGIWKPTYRSRRESKSRRDFYTRILISCDLPYSKWFNPLIGYGDRKTLIDKLKVILSGDGIADILSDPVAIPDFNVLTEKNVRLYAANQALRLKLAALIYEEKNGKLPETLAELAPQYIAAVPPDPFDGKQMRYDPRSGVIYSVGFNLVDDGGKENENIFERMTANFKTAQKDLVLRITPTGKHTPLPPF